MELVSIVVPIYKVEKYLQECIDSIVNQTYKDLQIILVDDGSPDGCGAICDSAAARDSRILVLHCENGGLSVARNRGMEISRGKYILFVDSDDYLERDAVEVLYKNAENENLEITMYDAISFDETNTGASTDDEIRKYIRQNTYPAVCSGSEMFLEMVKNDEYRSPVQYCFYRKDFLDQYNLSFHKGILHEDEEFNFVALLYADRVGHISNVLYHHRFRMDSIMLTKISRRNTDSLFEIIDVAMSKSELFLEDPKTENAYKVGIARFVQIYYCYLKISTDKNTSETNMQIKLLEKKFRKVRYYQDNRIKKAVRYGLRRPITIKAIKIKLYPIVKFFLRR